MTVAASHIYDNKWGNRCGVPDQKLFGTEARQVIVTLNLNNSRVNIALDAAY